MSHHSGVTHELLTEMYWAESGAKPGSVWFCGRSGHGYKTAERARQQWPNAGRILKATITWEEVEGA